MTAVLRHPLWRVVERNAIVGRRAWYVHLAGGAEPFLFLFSIGVGVGALVDGVVAPSGELVEYRDFIAPAMLAGSAMNTAVIDATINFFVRFKYIQTYDAMLATPLTPGDLVRGELTWSMLRVTLYSTAFVVTMLAMGLLASPWAVLAVPAAVLIGLAFGTVGMAASTWMTSSSPRSSRSSCSRPRSSRSTDIRVGSSSSPSAHRSTTVPTCCDGSRWAASVGPSWRRSRIWWRWRRSGSGSRSVVWAGCFSPDRRGAPGRYRLPSCPAIS
jgi:hypothetical protein